MSNGHLYFDESALELVKEVYDLGGGTIVVTELPEVGEEHTIYELHQNVEPAYNWVAQINDLIQQGGFNPGSLLVVETYDDMLEKVNEDTHLPEGAVVVVYLRAEDRMFANGADAESGNIMRMEFQKNSAYSFEMNGMRLYVLKSIYTGEEITEDTQYYGVLYNGNEVELRYNQDKAFILHQATYDIMDFFGSTGSTVHPVTQLPTAEELVANYLDNLVVNNGLVDIEIDGQVKYNLESSDYYHWDVELQNFVAVTEKPTEEPIIYTGPLEWEDEDYPTYTEIPYQDIFDGNISHWIFKPEQGGEKISYWIYANDEWVNVDDIPVPSTSLGVIYSNIRIDNPNVNNAVDIYYGEEKLEINDYYVFYPQTEEPSPIVAYATVSGLPLLNSETHDFVLTIHPKMDVDTENDRLSISVNGRNVYQSQWRQEIPLEISVIVEGISQIEIDVEQLPL